MSYRTNAELLRLMAQCQTPKNAQHFDDHLIATTCAQITTLIDKAVNEDDKHALIEMMVNHDNGMFISRLVDFIELKSDEDMFKQRICLLLFTIVDGCDHSIDIVVKCDCIKKMMNFITSEQLDDDPVSLTFCFWMLESIGNTSKQYHHEVIKHGIIDQLIRIIILYIPSYKKGSSMKEGNCYDALPGIVQVLRTGVRMLGCLWCSKHDMDVPVKQLNVSPKSLIQLTKMVLDLNNDDLREACCITIITALKIINILVM